MTPSVQMMACALTPLSMPSRSYGIAFISASKLHTSTKKHKYVHDSIHIMLTKISVHYFNNRINLVQKVKFELKYCFEGGKKEKYSV